MRLLLLGLAACSGAPEETVLPEEALVTDGCVDEVDNDEDGVLDCDDASCRREAACTDTGVQDTEDTQIEGCDDVAVDFSGPDDPKVGDTWTVFLECDGTNITSGLVIHVDPADLASVNGRTITFAKTGDGTLTVQGGAERADLALQID
jgi:hypothetical protein